MHPPHGEPGRYKPADPLLGFAGQRKLCRVIGWHVAAATRNLRPVRGAHPHYPT